MRLLVQEILIKLKFAFLQIASMITNTQLEHKGDLQPANIIKYSKDVDTIDFFTSNNVILRITVIRDSLLRFRYTTKGYFNHDFSYGIDTNQSHGYNILELSETKTHYVITTSKVICRIAIKDARITLTDLEGFVILEDEKGFHWEECHEYGGNYVKMSKLAKESECYYGLGDKATELNLKGKRLENWVTDQYAFDRDKEPLYKAIPFYIGLHHGISYGVFFDNTFKSFFDFCHEKRNVTSFWADGGEMNYYFFYGPKMSEVIKNYTHLTGKPEMPPLWALGFHQCKWSYYPEARVKEVAAEFRKRQIPCDGIYLDIDYMEGYRCFTWNKEYFPDPKRMVSELTADGFKTIAIIDPGIKIDPENSVYQEALEKDYFCKRADGPYMKGKVWPGECNFPDYTKPEVRTWWAGLFKELISEIGIKGIWNDMNEPAVMEVPTKTFPLDVRHDYDGNPCSHRKAHNVYGTQMARATYEGVKKYSYPKRPFVITRAAYSGAQRYCSTWTGDNQATWEHLWIANMQMQRMAMSGFSFCGSDVGGFAYQPTPELFARWVQLGTFHPFCRVHSSGDHGDQEPWSFGEEVAQVVKKFVEIRYQLLPYIYTMFYKYVNDGDPMLKPLVYFDQSDTQTYYRAEEFIFGSQILVCPIHEPNAKGRRMYLPKGEWYNFWTNKLEIGQREFWIDVAFDEMPIFVKAGAIIPKYPIQQYVGEKEITEVTLDVYFKLGKEKSLFYDDAHDGYDYNKGRFSLSTFQLTGKDNELIIQCHKDGRFDATYQHYILNLIGLPFKIKAIEIDNETIDLKEIRLNDFKLKISKDFSEIHVIGF
jgi:alpha-glucosidase